MTDVCDCDCGARGEGGGQVVGGYEKEHTAHTGTGAGDIPVLILRDSTTAAATWLDMARYSDTVGIFQDIRQGGGSTDY